MAGTPPIILGMRATDAPVPQAGARFSNRLFGMDDGTRTFLVHPAASKSLWPKNGDADRDNPSMYVVDVAPSTDPSTLVLLTVSYKGIAGNKPDRVTPDADVQMMTIPTTTSGKNGNTVVPVPQPRATREYVATSDPGLTGVGVATNATWLPSPPNWTLTYVPDSTKPATQNYFKNQWVLQSRCPEPIVPGKVWFVRETAVYYYSLASS